MSAFQEFAIARLLNKAAAMGVEVPSDLAAKLAAAHDGSYPARRWATEHPDEERIPCCEGSAYMGPERCTCWTAVYDEDQQPPRPPAGPADLQAQPRMCGDCAFRPGSPERADEYTCDALVELTHSPGTPFWCHQGMRRPARWVHPNGRVVPGSPDDWQPPRINGVPYRADGSPGLLCAGWAALAARNAVPPTGEEAVA